MTSSPGTNGTHPKLALVPVLGKGVHGQLGLAGVLLLGLGLQLGKLLGAGIALGVELLERVEGRRRERAASVSVSSVSVSPGRFRSGLQLFVVAVVAGHLSIVWVGVKRGGVVTK
jgi:hypothetical protein